MIFVANEAQNWQNAASTALTFDALHCFKENFAKQFKPQTHMHVFSRNTFTFPVTTKCFPYSFLLSYMCWTQLVIECFHWKTSPENVSIPPSSWWRYSWDGPFKFAISCEMSPPVVAYFYLGGIYFYKSRWDTFIKDPIYMFHMWNNYSEVHCPFSELSIYWRCMQSVQIQ